MLLVVQLGQCGNQVGAAFLEASYPNTHLFHATHGGETALACALAIDTENKVVNALPRSGRWAYNAKNCIVGSQLGAGNNWAFGYIFPSYFDGRYARQGPAIWPRVQERVRREVGEMTRFDGFLVLMSVAGGTGSGLGKFAVYNGGNFRRIRNGTA